VEVGLRQAYRRPDGVPAGVAGYVPAPRVGELRLSPTSRPRRRVIRTCSGDGAGHGRSLPASRFCWWSQRDLNPCLHLERLSRAGSVTRGGDGKRPVTCGFSSWSIPVATPRFSLSCGIFAGSAGELGLQPPFGSHSARRSGSLVTTARAMAARRSDRPHRRGDRLRPALIGRVEDGAP
jgi:hypothetical protein